MLNSTIVANINGGITTNQKVSGGLRSSLLLPVDFNMTEVKTNSASCDQRKAIQRSAPKGSHNTFNGQSKSYLDQNRNSHSKQVKLMNGNKNAVDSTEDSIPLPKVCLYSGRISSEWQQVHKIGAGLVNIGNTCFLNTVLQCLTYCPPLANYLLHDTDHTNKCRITGFCMMCELQQHMKKAISRSGELVKPITIYHKLPSIAKHFQFGRQEDAHEFLRYLIDHLWKACLSTHEGFAKLDPASKETTVINQIFGGYHRSQVTCLRCKEKSNTYDHFMDLMLDIRLNNESVGHESGFRKGSQNSHTLEKALERFIHPELLQNDNAYKCPKCKMKVSAQKRLTVFKAPNVATFQFKRFDYHRICGGKITRHIGYTENLNLRPYMSNPKGGPVLYRLNAVLVHLGSTCNSGHYFCYVRNSNGFWYIMDDVRVSQVSLNQVLNQNAYVLFYVRVNPSDTLATRKAGENISANLKNGFVGSGHGVSANVIPRPLANAKPAALQGMSKLSVSSVGLTNGTSLKTQSKSNLQPLPQKRGKIAFTISSASNVNNLKHATAAAKPTINNVKSTSNSSKGIVNGNTLVPYVEDSSDFSDDDINDNNRQSNVKSAAKPLGGKANVAVKGKNNNSVTSRNDIQKNSLPTKETKLSSKESVSFLKETKVSAAPSSETKMSLAPPKEIICPSPSRESKIASAKDAKMSASSTATSSITERVSSGTLVSKAKQSAGHSVPLPEPVKSKDTAIVAKDESSKTTSTFLSLNQLPSASSTSLVKVNATSSWTVTEINLQSPSIASGSSTNSVNSTTDWNTNEQEQIPKKSLDGRVVGSISLHKPEKRLSLSNVCLKAKVKSFRVSNGKDNSGTSTSSSIKSADVTEKLEVANGDCATAKLIKSPVTASAPDLSPLNADSIPGESENPKPDTPLEKSHSRPDLTGDSQLPFRKQPFHASSSKESFLGDRESIFPISPFGQTPNRKTQSTSQRTIGDDTKDAGSKRTSRFFDHREDGNGPMLKKLKTEHSKGEREHSILIQSGSSISPKENEKRSAHLNVSSHSRTNDTSPNTSRHVSENYNSTKQKDTKYSSPNKRTSDGLPKKVHDSNGISSDESSDNKYEVAWVEKKRHSASISKGTSKYSDHKQENGRGNGESSRSDHSKSRDVVSELQRNSYQLFGTEVGSWSNNRRSPIRQNKPRRYFDDYDEELDKGKMRHHKTQYYERNQYRYNPFQSFENNRRQEKDGFKGKWHTDKYDSKNRYHQDRHYNDNRHHKNYHNKYYPKSQFNKYKHFNRH